VLLVLKTAFRLCDVSCHGRADCQVSLVKRLAAMAMFVNFAGLCVSNVVYNVNIGWYGAGPSGEVTVWQ
jgi:hypothetical protein